MKIKTKIKIILAILLTLTLVTAYNHRKNAQRLEYAAQNNCEWVIYGAHDICR